MPVGSERPSAGRLFGVALGIALVLTAVLVWLVAAAYTQLRLVRAAVADRRLPWERPLPPERLTPGRVQRSIVPLAGFLPPVAAPPRPCGRSPGRPKGRRSAPAARYPPLKRPSTKRIPAV